MCQAFLRLIADDVLLRLDYAVALLPLWLNHSHIAIGYEPLLVVRIVLLPITFGVVFLLAFEFGNILLRDRIFGQGRDVLFVAAALALYWDRAYPVDIDYADLGPSLVGNT